MAYPITMFLPSAVLLTVASLPRIRSRKVGGIRFLRIGRFQFSFCRCRQSI